MFTPEDVPMDSGDEASSQQRRSLMAAAIRRGEVKISEPILWIEGVPNAPTSQRAVSSFVEPDAGPQIIQEPDGDQIPGTAVSTDEHATAVPFREGPSLRRRDSSDPIREVVESQNLSTLGDDMEGTSEQKRSMFVEEEMAIPSPVSQEKKKARRSGTIRTVLRKVFGRKDKRQSRTLVSSPPQSRAGPKHEHSRSDPLPSTRPTTADRRGEIIAPKTELGGSEDKDMNDFSAPHPPMLPFPMNVNAPQKPSPDQKVPKTVNYTSFETGPRVHRRRATLPSMILSPEDVAGLHRIWSSSDLAPDSASERRTNQDIPSPNIGIAISSGGPNPNRRSRSAGALHEMAKRQEQHSQLRRRSSEIQYWRASRMQSQRVEDQISVRRASPTGSTDNSSIGPVRMELSEAFAGTGSSVREEQLHPFDFGAEGTESATAEQAATIMEQRLSQLEIDMQRMSMSLHNYSARADPPREREFMLKQPPRTHGSRNSLGADPRVGLGLQSSPPRLTAVRFTQPRPAPSPSPSKTSLQQSDLYSPITATTNTNPQPSNLPHQPVQYPPAPSSVHSAPNYSAIPSISHNTLFEHIAPLYEALRWERQNRKALEAQVYSMRADLVELSAVVDHLQDQAIYVKNASPSPPLHDAPAVKQHKGFSAVTNGERSRFSGYDSDDEEEHAPRGNVPQETWTTPREEQSMQWDTKREGGYI